MSRATFICLGGLLRGGRKPRPFCHILVENFGEATPCDKDRPFQTPPPLLSRSDPEVAPAL